MYKENLKAINNSLAGLLPGRFLVDWFNNPRGKYFSHGVNIDDFIPLKNKKIKDHKLLCLANNGVAGMDGYDRKGFTFAIQAAMALNLPITIA